MSIKPVIESSIQSIIRPAIGFPSTVDPILATDHPDLIFMYDMGDSTSESTQLDLSPNGYDATIFGATASAGDIGNALDFDGTDYLSIPIAIAAAAGTTGAFSFRVKPTIDSGFHRIFSCSNSTNDLDYFFIGVNANKIEMNPNSGVALRSAGTLVNNTWNRVVVQSTGTKTTIAIEGVEADAVAIVGIDNGDWIGDVSLPNFVNIARLSILSGNLPVNNPASVDQVRLFNRTHTQSEITAITNET